MALGDIAAAGPGGPLMRSASAAPVVTERFARGRDHTAGEPGSGPGLSIARTFIMALGGRIEIDDPALGGVGARVSLAVPRRRDGAGEHRRI